MGFLDKAKLLAEQAQQKLDEAQKNFNESASPQAEGGERAVRYDEHGRPIQEASPAGAATPPAADPDALIADPEAPPPGEGAAAAAPPAPGPPPDPASPPPPPDALSGMPANASPDPFKPLEQ